jgi:dihydroorotase/N-acyl-D-amino-acid deacylase
MKNQKHHSHFTSLAIMFVLVILISTGLPGSARYDLIIEKGTIIDGLGNKPFKADIGIRNGQIIKIGNLSNEKPGRRINAVNLIVCPGFIDLHSHADGRILEQPDAHNCIRQGITTVLTGNCGSSHYPIGEFLTQVNRKKTALNFCTLVGHNTIRGAVMGNADRPPTPEEMKQMRQMVEQAMKEGAMGLSAGLKYPPAMYAETGEVIELAKVAAKYGGFYATHMREEGIGVLPAIEETVKIGKMARIPVHISHHKVAGVDRWGYSKKTLALIDRARESGLDVTLDLHPYRATSTGLTILFPPWALEGNPKEWKKRWNDPKIKPRLIKDIIHNIKHDRGGNDLDRIMIARYSPEPKWERATIAGILKTKKIPPTFENGAELIIEMQLKALDNGKVQAIYFCLDRKDIRRIIQHPFSSIITDGGIATRYVGNPHPRNYGSFPRVIRVYVRDEKVLSMEEAIRKMTSLPAQRLGLKNRGRIEEGCYADITIFHPVKVTDTAAWNDSHSYPMGMPYVLVNGVPVVENRKITGAFPGVVIYGKGREK